MAKRKKAPKASGPFTIVGWEANPARAHEGVKEGHIVIGPTVLCVYVCNKCGTSNETPIDLRSIVAGMPSAFSCLEGCK